MRNFTASETNSADFQCSLCQHSPIFPSLLLPYGLISGSTNIWVLWLMTSSPAFWTNRMEVSEFHLVLTELFIGFMQPIISTSIIFSTKAVGIMSKLVDIILTARIQFQSAVCMERYLAVVHPVLYLRFKPLRYRMFCCCFMWLKTIMIGIMQVFVCSENAISVTTYTVTFVLVVIVNSFCCLSVLRALKQPSPGDGERQRSNMIKRRAFVIMLIFLVTTVVGYVPLIIMSILIGRIDINTVCIWQPLSYCVMLWLGILYPFMYLRKAGKNCIRNYLCVFSSKHT